MAESDLTKPAWEHRGTQNVPSSQLRNYTIQELICISCPCVYCHRVMNVKHFFPVCFLIAESSAAVWCCALPRRETHAEQAVLSFLWDASCVGVRWLIRCVLWGDTVREPNSAVNISKADINKFIHTVKENVKMCNEIYEESSVFFFFSCFLVILAFNYIWLLLLNRGYYPQGGGEVVVQMSPVKELSPINLTERGTVTKIYGRAFVAGALPIKVSADNSFFCIKLHVSV